MVSLQRMTEVFLRLIIYCALPQRKLLSMLEPDSAERFGTFLLTFYYFFLSFFVFEEGLTQ